MVTQRMVYAEDYGVPLVGCDDRYEDRAMAGRQLAALLQPYRGSRAMVLALPPGGVAVAGELARSLRLPVDVLVAREFVLRRYPALAAGALSEGGGLCLNTALLRLPDASLRDIWHEAACTQHEIVALVGAYREGRALPAFGRHPIILVDDGLGSGLAQLAALAALRRAHSQRCIVATPGGAPAALELVGRWADTIVTLDNTATRPADSMCHWQQAISDDDAAILLRRYSPIGASR